MGQPATVWVTFIINPELREEFLERWRDFDEFLNEILRRDYYQPLLQLSEKALAAPREVMQLNPIEPFGQLRGLPQ